MLLGIDDGQPLEQGNVTKPLVGADELIDGGGLLNRESHRELKGVKGVDLPRLPVPGDEVAGGLEVSIQDADRGHRAIPDIGVEPQVEPVEVGFGNLSGPDLLREDRISPGRASTVSME